MALPVNDMTYEVEQKFHLQNRAAFESELRSRGAAEEPVQIHSDTYYNHPCRDFAATHEAFRIRRVGGIPMITYKGSKLPGTVKARREMEWRLDPGDQDGEQTAELLELLGFKPVATLRKKRQPFVLADGAVNFGVVIDEVENLGEFVEIELLVKEEDEIESAREKIQSMATRLGLHQVEVRSYLRMILAENTSE